MRELFDGVHHWTTVHEEIDQPVSSYLLASSGIALDPMVPEGGFDALPSAPSQVVLTSGLHTRHAARFAERFGIPIRVSREGADRIGGELDVETYTDGDELAPGVRAIRIGVLCPDEYALALDGALAFADGLHHYGDEVGFFPDDLLGDDPEGVREGLRERYRRLLDLEPEHLLFAHGDPIVGGGADALRAAVG